MKYLFVNAVAGSGSTGKIAADKCRELQAQGHQCVLAYGRWQANCDDIETYKIGTAFDYHVHGLYTRLFDRHGFGSRRATKKFLKWVFEYDPDVIWIHNLHGYYINIQLFFDYLKQAGKKVYWTLHDCWTFTGHCSHFTYMKCDKWKTGCYQCCQKNRYPKSLFCDRSRKNYLQKKQIFTGVRDMTIITPSKWLEELVKESFLGEYKTEVVYNTVDIGIFKPTPSNFREKYGLEDKKVILGVANVWDERKGLNDFIRLSRMLDDRYVIVLVGLSRKQIRRLFGQVKGIEHITDMKELAAVYSEADVFVNPSVEETFGMTTVEAQACGTKAIVYEGTACEEIVGRTAWNVSQAQGIAIPDNVESLYKCVTEILGGV